MVTNIVKRILFGATLITSICSAQASPLYGADGTLYKIDATNGASVAINSGNNAYRVGLSFNGATNMMYSIGLFDGTLSKLDLSTGVTTVVGDNNFSMTGLTFNADYSRLYSLNGNGGALLSVNPDDDSAFVIGSGNSDVPMMLDLSTNGAGTLYGGGFGGIGTYNTTTGAFSLIGGALTWTAIAFDENDILYGIEINSDALYRINTVDGSATLVGGKIGVDVRGMDFVFSNNSVPEPASLALLGLGLIGLGLSRRKMR